MKGAVEVFKLVRVCVCGRCLRVSNIWSVDIVCLYTCMRFSAFFSAAAHRLE